MNNFLARRAVIVLLICTFLRVSAFAADVKEVVKNARNSYYTLKGQGLKNFKCDVAPDWQKFLENVDKKPPSADDPRLQKFKGLHFTVAIDEQGQSIITPYMAGGGDIDPNLNEMISGFKEMLSGFYQTWTALVLTNPFSEAYGDLTLKQEGEDVRLLGKDGGSDVEILLNKDYAIAEMRVRSAASTIIMFPKFNKTPQGLLLAAVDSDINNGTQKVFIDIHYQDVEGFQLPRQALLRVTLPAQVIAVEVAFSKYQVTKR